MPRLSESTTFSFLAIVFVATAVSLVACAQKTVTPSVLPKSVKLETLAVMPYIDMYKIYGDNVSFNCPLCGRSEVIDIVSKGADQFLTESLVALLQERGGYQLIPPGRVEGAQSTLLLDPGQKMADLDMILEIGRKLGADGVVLGRVYRFRERRGNDYSAETSASVSFDLLLVYVPDGQLLWERHFNESQQALSENLFNLRSFIDRKGRWLTARELAASGLQQVLASFPNAN